jgi:hypothetical protein
MGRAKQRPRKGSPWTWAISVLVAAAALLVGSEPTARLAHFAGERHVVCEHGELIHVEKSEADPSEPRSTHEGVAARPGGSTQSGHTHCALATRGRTTYTSLTPPSVASFTGPIGTTVAVAITVVEPRTVWWFAPKTSPPSLA